MTKQIRMDESKLAIISIAGVGISVASVVIWLQIAALIVSIIAGILAIRKHFKG